MGFHVIAVVGMRGYKDAVLQTRALEGPLQLRTRRSNIIFFYFLLKPSSCGSGVKKIAFTLRKCAVRAARR